MRSQTIQGIAQAALQMFVQRMLCARLVVVGDWLVQDAPVAGLL